jgi:hypothetical protein
MLPLTIQQRTRRCRCERYLAWPLLAEGAVIAGYGQPVCVACFRPLERCRWPWTSRPADGCFTLDYARVREPEGDDPDCE